MNRYEFWLEYAKYAGISQDESKKVCKSVFEFLSKCIVEEDRVHVYGLGSFSRKKIKARNCRNVLNGEMIVIPEREKIVFRPSEELCKLVKQNMELDGALCLDAKKDNDQ